MAVLTAEIDEETKRKAEAVLQPAGFTTAEVMRWTIVQIAQNNALPPGLLEAAREERDFKIAAERRGGPEGASLDEMRKKYGL
jgi:addiction module RelB/DinJ family antitoxin